MSRKAVCVRPLRSLRSRRHGLAPRRVRHSADAASRPFRRTVTIDDVQVAMIRTGEGARADGTRERSLVGVATSVSRQFVGARERHRTAEHGAAERLVTCRRV